MTSKHFEEIAHSGGKVTLTVVDDGEGGRGIQFSWTNSRPVPSTLIGVYALPNGLAVGTYSFGYKESDVPPMDGAVPVPLASDSEGRFGHKCRACGGYWRSGPFPQLCPYCKHAAPSYEFLSDAQKLYVRYYCDLWQQAEIQPVGAMAEIDMDAIADATINGSPRPEFYVSEERQQTSRECSACGQFQDILGRFGYCAMCGSRNDFDIFAKDTVPTIRDRLSSGSPPEGCLRDAVSAFDALSGQFAKQLAGLVPMTPMRRHVVKNDAFSSLSEKADRYSAWFDIDLRKGISQTEWDAAIRMFFRRHVYEHNGGVVDQTYLTRSSDGGVRLGEAIFETPASVHPFLATLTSIAKRLHDGFHELVPPNDLPIKAFEEKQARLKMKTAVQAKRSQQS